MDERKFILMARFILLIFLFVPLALRAQFTYTLDHTIPVHTLNDRLLKMPWAGGLNAPQYNTIDLNGDSNVDLVLFDRMANKVLTFIKQDNQYVYDPNYEAYFPKEIVNWVLLRDYNCDGKKDMFTSDPLGMRVYTNTTQPGGVLSWKQVFFFAVAGEPKSPVLLTKGFNDLINLQLQYDDLPSIMDADGDGDLDIFCMQYGGNSAELHKNFSKERYGTCDSLAFERVTQRWGNFSDCTCASFAFNGATCPPPGGRVEHVGGKSVLTLDVDGDNDLDLLYSESTCTSIYLLKNEGTTANPVLNNYINFPAITPATFSVFPSAYYEDLDFDGLHDIMITPSIYSKTSLLANLAASNWFYKNTGTAQTPSFTFVKNNFLQDEMIDVGDNSIPAFADYDGDGDYDLFISQNATQSARSTIFLYENTGTATVPELTLKSNDYLGFSALNLYNLKIQFADINGDAKTDLLYTATGLQTQATNAYYLSSVFQLPVKSPQTLILSLSTPDNVCFADIGGSPDGKPDGSLDILIGKNNGSLEYWQNDGALNFTLKNPSFLGIKTSITRQNPTCTVADLDNDAKPDLITSDQSGILTIISNFHDANENSERITKTILSPLADSTYVARNFGGRTWPTVVNLYTTDKPNIVVGSILGGMQVLKNTQERSTSKEPVIRIYPNPVSQNGRLTIKVDRDATVQIFSALGQTLNYTIPIKGSEAVQFMDTSLARGVYFFRFVFGKKYYTKRVVIY